MQATMDPRCADTPAAGTQSRYDPHLGSLSDHTLDEGFYTAPFMPSASRHEYAPSRPSLNPANWPGEQRIPEATGHYGHGPVHSQSHGSEHEPRAGYAAAGYQARQQPPLPSFGSGGSTAVATSSRRCVHSFAPRRSARSCYRYRRRFRGSVRPLLAQVRRRSSEGRDVLAPISTAGSPSPALPTDPLDSSDTDDDSLLGWGFSAEEKARQDGLARAAAEVEEALMLPRRCTRCVARSTATSAARSRRRVRVRDIRRSVS